MTPGLHDHALELRILATLADVSGLDVTEAKNAAERSGLVTEDFHNPLHANVWTAQMGLLHDGEAADFYRVSTRLKVDERPKLAPLIEAAGQVGVSLLIASAIRGPAADLRTYTLRRNILRFGRDLAAQAENNSDPAVLLTNATAALHRITTSRAANWSTLGEARVQARFEMELVASGIGTPVIPTGLKEWDRIVGGLWPTLTVIGAHPGHGKSGFLARLLMNIAQSGRKVSLFSLEDNRTWLAYRAMSAESGLSQFVLRNRVLNEEQKDLVHHGETAMGSYENNIEVDDRGALPPSELVQCSRDAILNRGAKAIVVDHFGEVRLGDDNGRNDRHDLMIASALSDLRNLAKQYGVPIVVAAHLKPQAVYPFTAHDFRNASAFEQMSRVAVMWEKSGDELKMLVNKNQFGICPAKFSLPFHGPSAMVLNELPTTQAVQEALL